MNGFGLHGFEIGFVWLVLLLIVAVIIFFYKTSDEEESSAMEILDRRYAKGEIDDDEYKTKKKNLEEHID